MVTVSYLLLLEITSPSSAPSQRAVCSPGWVVLCPWPRTLGGPPLDSQPSAATSSAPGKSISLLPLDGQCLKKKKKSDSAGCRSSHPFPLDYARTIRVQIVWDMTLPLSSCMTSGESVTFSELSLPQLKNSKYNCIYWPQYLKWWESNAAPHKAWFSKWL